MDKSKKRWEQFEDQVSYLYQTLGNKVQRNVGIMGHQVDLILITTLSGGIITKTAVECKYLEKGNVSKNSVIDNINALRDLRANNMVQNLVIITTNGFSKDVWDTANKNNIQLLTLRELQIEIINFESYIDKIIHDFENFDEYKDGQRKPIIDVLRRCNLYKYYIHLRCRDSKNIIYNPIDKYIEEWLNNENKNHIILLGDYGTGKSSFLLYLTYVLAKSFKEDPFNVPLPIFISLKNYKRIKDIQKLIMDLLKNDYNLIIPSTVHFQKLLEDGRLILLFDGFDEMESRSNKKIILKNFEELIKVITKKSKVVLTSRTHYFKTHSQVTDIFNPQYDTELLRMIRGSPDFELIELLEFNNKQIIEFLSRHTENYMNYWQKIRDTYNLEDLSKRPILLEMIIRSLPTIMKAGKEINASELYNIYTNIWVKREDWRSVMNVDEKEIFMEELALHMFLNNIQDVHYSKLNKIVQEHFKRRITSMEDIESFDTDTRTCSFLNRDENGNYKFIHRSFMEFFVAKRFSKEVNKGKIIFFKERLLPPEIIDFMSKIIMDRNKLYDIIYQTHNDTFDKVRYMGGNAISILNLMGETFDKKDFSNTILCNANFEGTVCDNSNFSNAVLIESNFINSSLLYTNFERADLKDALIEDIGYVTSIDFDQKENRMAFGTSTGYVFVIEMNTFNKIQIMKESNNRIIKIKFFGDDEFIGSVDSENKISIWNSTSFKKFKIKEKINTIYKIDFHPNNSKIIIINSEDKIKLIDFISNREGIVPLKEIGNTEYIHILFVNKGDTIIISDSDNNLKHIRCGDGSVIESIKSKLKNINEINYKKSSGLLHLCQIEERTVKRREKMSLEENILHVYEIINLKNKHVNIINAGPLGQISDDSQLMLTIKMEEELYSHPFYKKKKKMIELFEVIELNSGKVLRKVVNESLRMQRTDRELSRYKPKILFSQDNKFIYISDYTGKLIRWDWTKEPPIEKQERTGIKKTMSKSKFINENIFKCEGMSIKNVHGLKEKQLQILIKKGAKLGTSP